MVNIKRQFSRGYILLESLLALSLLTIITTLILSEMTDSQRRSQVLNQQIETLNVSEMALDAGLSNLTANGISVNISQNGQALLISGKSERAEASGEYYAKEELRFEILEVQK